jgi:predicted outer membrane repeat protein
MSNGRLLFGIACVLLVFSIAQADTTYVDTITITSPTTWAASGNPYIIRGGVRIQSVFTLEPGVKVYFESGILPKPGILVESGASIIAVGTEVDSISFAPTDTSQRCGHIKVQGTALFSYCRFSYMYSSNIFNPGTSGALDYYIIEDSCKVSHCYFGYNQAPEVGGAISTLIQHPGTPPLEISDSYFIGNFSDMGGGAIWLESPAIIKRNVFIQNHTDIPGLIWGAGQGGAVWSNYSDITVEENSFLQNSARDGGAFATDNAGLKYFSKNLFANNTARCSGGAMYFSGSTVIFKNGTIIGNTCDSSGGAYGRLGGGSLIFNNCIIRNNTFPQFADSLNITYSDIQGGYPGTGNIDIDPQFVNAGAGNFHLTCSSPCIDAGDPASPLDPDYTRADMGAYYYHHMNGSGDANYDCQVMGADVTYLVRYFKGIGAAPYPLWRGDASGDTIVAGADVVYLVRYLKGLGNPPVKNPNCNHPDWSIPDSCNPCGY